MKTTTTKKTGGPGVRRLGNAALRALPLKERVRRELNKRDCSTAPAISREFLRVATTREQTEYFALPRLERRAYARDAMLRRRDAAERPLLWRRLEARGLATAVLAEINGMREIFRERRLSMDEARASVPAETVRSRARAVLLDLLRAGGLVPVSKSWTNGVSPARAAFEKAWAQVLAELELKA